MARSGDDLAESLGETANLDLLMDVDMKLTVELGRARLKFRDVLNLTSGSVVELAKLTSEPVDIMVNGALLATAELYDNDIPVWVPVPDMNVDRYESTATLLRVVRSLRSSRGKRRLIG